MSKDLKDKTLSELEQIVLAIGRKKYLAGYIFHFIHSKNIKDVSQITPLSKAFREQLIEQRYFISRLEVVKKLTGKDGTVKFVFGLSDGDVIETVLLHDGKRKTLCVSTQIGCAMRCVFCATGRIELKRNLTAGEIVDQVNAVQEETGRISNVVFMGMGEPLENFDEVVKSVRILNDPEGKNIGIRHLTVSTCGLVLEIKKLADEDIHPRLAVSLNAPTDKLRSKLMPINKKYPLAKLLNALKKYQLRLKDRVTFEYVMINGINDSLANAKELVKLVRGIKCNVNLIEFNPHPGCKFSGSKREIMSRFAEALGSAGIETVIRLKKGSDIYAACGQLGARTDNI